jgi:tetratricopeptide (TPR) repeat protein
MTRTTKILLALGIILALIFSSLIAWGVFLFERERRAAQAMVEAERAESRKDFDGAITQLSRALELQLFPAQKASAYYERARLESDKFKYDEAIRDFNEAIRLRYRGAEAYWGRGWAYQCKREWDKALKDYARFLRREQNVGQVYFNRGLIFLEQKKWKRARNDFSEAIRCEPNNANAFLNRAKAHLEMNNLDGALASADSAISLEPAWTEAYALRAKIHRRRNELNLARVDDRLASHLPAERPTSSPWTVADFLKRARFNLLAHRYEEVIDLCDRALSANLSSYFTDALITRGNAYLGLGDWGRALRDFDEAIKLSPENSGAFFGRGNAYVRKKEREKAIADFSEAIRLKPAESEAWYNRARASLAMEKIEQALSDFSEAIRLNPKFAEAYAHRALALLRAKRGDEALKDAQAAVALSPENSEFSDIQAHVHFTRREFAEARADFERALQLDPRHHPALLNNMAWFYATCADGAFRDGKKAVALAEEACTKMQWKYASHIDTLASAYAETGDFTQAVKFEEQALSLPTLPRKCARRCNSASPFIKSIFPITRTRRREK